MKPQQVIRDERFYAVENASYRIGFLILSFGIMGLIVIRAVLFQQTHWDFFALVWISSVAATIYQIRHKILPYSLKSFHRMFVLGLLTATVAALVVLALTLFLNK